MFPYMFVYIAIFSLCPHTIDLRPLHATGKFLLQMFTYTVHTLATCGCDKFKFVVFIYVACEHLHASFACHMEHVACHKPYVCEQRLMIIFVPSSLFKYAASEY